jgi:hypothetical protein
MPNWQCLDDGRRPFCVTDPVCGKRSRHVSRGRVGTRLVRVLQFHRVGSAGPGETDAGAGGPQFNSIAANTPLYLAIW